VARVGGSLRALVRAGGWVSLGAALDQVVSAEEASLGSEDEPPLPPADRRAAPATASAAAATAFELHGTLVELSGPFKLLMPGPGTREHNGRLIVTVPQLDEGNQILLLPGGCISHPLCETPAPAPGGQMQRRGDVVVARARTAVTAVTAAAAAAMAPPLLPPLSPRGKT
jgi:hypothetical protein